MTTQYFVGKYVKDIVDLLVGSLLANQHVLIISEPGEGKTTILKKAAHKMAGRDHFSKLGVTPMTSPDRITGHVDPKIFATTGDYVINQQATPFNPDMRVMLVDELPRAGEPFFDAMIQAADPDNQDHCVLWSTGNFTVDDTRASAMWDRIPLVFHLPAEIMDTETTKAVIAAQLLSGGDPELPGDVPDWVEIEAARSAVPGHKALEAIQAYILDIKQEAEIENFRINKRRLAQWQRLLYRAGVYYSGDQDFAALPEQAKALMRFAYPTLSQQDAILWQKIVRAMVDRLQVEIDDALASVMPEFTRVAEMESSIDRFNESAKLGEALGRAQERLNKLVEGLADDSPDRVKIETAIDDVKRWFSWALDGKIEKIKVD